MMLAMAPNQIAMQGGSVSQIAGINRFSRMVPSGDPPPRPEPDSVTKGVMEAAKNDRIKAIADCKAVADADAAEVEKAKARVAVEAESSKILSKEAIKLELAADKAQKKLVMIRSGIKRLKDSPVKGEGAALELQGLEADAKAQETLVKDAVEKAKESAKKAHAAIQNLAEEQNKLDAVRVAAARSKANWQSECFLASIATGDSSFADGAETSQQALVDKIDQMIEASPTMESIIATRIELEQGNYPKPPAWLMDAGVSAPTYSATNFQPGGVNSYSGDFNMDAFPMQTQIANAMSSQQQEASAGQMDVGSEAWMAEQDALLQSMVHSAMASGKRS